MSAVHIVTSFYFFNWCLTTGFGAQLSFSWILLQPFFKFLIPVFASIVHFTAKSKPPWDICSRVLWPCLLSGLSVFKCHRRQLYFLSSVLWGLRSSIYWQDFWNLFKSTKFKLRALKSECLKADSEGKQRQGDKWMSASAAHWLPSVQLPNSWLWDGLCHYWRWETIHLQFLHECRPVRNVMNNTMMDLAVKCTMLANTGIRNLKNGCNRIQLKESCAPNPVVKHQLKK